VSFALQGGQQEDFLKANNCNVFDRVTRAQSLGAPYFMKTHPFVSSNLLLPTKDERNGALKH
jgi:hypothetical protein